MITQLRLPFPEWSPATVALTRLVAWANHVAQRYPVTPHEERNLPPNVRLRRLVPGAECEICPFASQDHRLSPQGVILICVKDHFKTLPRKETP